MTAFTPARPRHTLSFAGQEYEMLGTFGMIEAVEHAMQEHVGRVAVRLVAGVVSGNEADGMPTSDLAKLLGAVLTACGHPTTAKEAGARIYDSVGLIGTDNTALRLHLYSFLCVSLAPPGEREQRANEVGELVGKLTAATASPGATTGASAEP